MMWFKNKRGVHIAYIVHDANAIVSIPLRYNYSNGFLGTSFLHQCCTLDVCFITSFPSLLPIMESVYRLITRSLTNSFGASKNSFGSNSIFRVDLSSYLKCCIIVTSPTFVCIFPIRMPINWVEKFERLIKRNHINRIEIWQLFRG